MLMDIFLNIFSIFQPTSNRHGIPNFTQVEYLADYLYSLRNQDLALTHDQASHIVRLWDLLTNFDKQPTVPSPRHSLRLAKVSTSKYKSRNKQSVVPGVDTVNRLAAFIVWCKIVLFYQLILIQVFLFLNVLNYVACFQNYPG